MPQEKANGGRCKWCTFRGRGRYLTSPLATKVQGSWRGVAVLFVAMEAKEVAGCNGEAARVWFDVDLVVGRRFACWRLTLRAMVRLSARKEGAALTARGPGRGTPSRMLCAILGAPISGSTSKELIIRINRTLKIS